MSTPTNLQPKNILFLYEVMIIILNIIMKGYVLLSDIVSQKDHPTINFKKNLGIQLI